MEHGAWSMELLSVFSVLDLLSRWVVGSVGSVESVGSSWRYLGFLSWETRSPSEKSM